MAEKNDEQNLGDHGEWPPNKPNEPTEPPAEPEDLDEAPDASEKDADFDAEENTEEAVNDGSDA